MSLIAVSANVNLKTREKLDNAGFYSYCSKPVNFDKLVRLVLSAINENPQAG